MKNCTPFWHEAHFEVKMRKTHQVRTTFGSCDVEKVTSLWRKAHFEVKMHKTNQVRPLLEVAMSQKCTPLWREAHFQVKMYNVQNTPAPDHFWKLRCRKSARRCGAKHICKDAFSVAGAVQETASSVCVTGAALRMTWHHVFVVGAVFFFEGSRAELLRF